MQNYGKYIVLKNFEVIIFSKSMGHTDFLRSFDKSYIESAGFFDIGFDENKNISVSTFGRSSSLGISSCPEDGKLIAKVLNIRE